MRSRLWTECPLQSLEGKITLTSEIYQRMVTFLAKYIRDPKKGIDRSWQSCQDKLLDVVGPLTKILDMAEDEKDSGNPDLSGNSFRAGTEGGHLFGKC